MGLLISAVAILLVGGANAPQCEIRAVDPHRVEVVAVLPSAALRVLSQGAVSEEAAAPWLVFRLVDPQTQEVGLPMLGDYQRVGNQLRFSPRRRLVAGLTYRAELPWSKNKSGWATHQVPPLPEAPAPTVENIYPTAKVLPANLLKFYICFSRPMRESAAIFDQVDIVDDQGNAVDDPWRRTEMWSRDGKRLTLWIHPGRVKLGVNLREQFGPVLEPERTYRLVVHPQVCDVDGKTLAKPFVKEFRVMASDRARPLLQQWRLRLPQAGTHAPVVITFVKPMDRFIAERRIQVRDAQEKIVPGNSAIGAEERSWKFTPSSPWQTQTYSIVTDEYLEDWAGNTPAKTFEVDLEHLDLASPSYKLRFVPVR